MTILKTIPWVMQATRSSKSENYEEILKRFGVDLEKSSASIDYGKEPVNICIMDGGGMKGEKDYLLVFLADERGLVDLIKLGAPAPAPPAPALLVYVY